MQRKYFPLDKNYLLERAQLDQEDILIRIMVDHVLTYYKTCCNPLGIEDDTIRKIKAYTFSYPESFHEFYRDLAGIYRFQKGENQLELLFDGTDHYTKYTRDWGESFCNWIKDFCLEPSFIKAVFSLTVFRPENNRMEFSNNRLKYFLERYFELKVYKYRGIQRMKIA